MAVGLNAPEKLLPINGVKLATTYCGIRKANADDLVLFELADGCTTAATFTRNAFCAAPVQVARDHLSSNGPRYLLVNAGNANAGTGEHGMQAAQQSCQAVADVFNVNAHQVLPFSTGVIGEYLPVDKIQQALPALAASLNEANWLKAAHGIMTTDTAPKAYSEQVKISDGRVISITGISKGAGMICPDMATMLAYIATDAAVNADELQAMLTVAVEQSFNSITVDGDTSTNDACVLVATGKATKQLIRINTPDGDVLQEAVNSVLKKLAQAIVRDAEGATKFVSLIVNGGKSVAECKQLAYTIAHSPLVKTAFFASDPNWGRILAAIGRAGLSSLDLDKVSFSLNGVSIVKNGGRDPEYTEEQGVQVMQADDIEIAIELGRGSENHTVWTCDLGYDYVRINAEYRT